MRAILYLDDYINFYDKNTNEIIKIIPYKDTLRYGIIIDRNKFIKKMIKELNKLKYKNSLFNNEIDVIISNYYTNEDKLIIKDVLDELNYKNVFFIQEEKYLNINKNNVYINCNYSYFYLLYTNYYGNTVVNLYKNDLINKSIFINIIDQFKDKNIFLYGKNASEFESILKKYDINYYIYEEKDNLIIKYLLNVNML